MKEMKFALFVPLLLVLAAAAAFAINVPFLSGRINDNANLLSPESEQRLDAMLKAYEDSTTNQFAVLTVTTLEGETIEEYSIKVAETWKLGQKGVDNGALLIVAKDDRKLRIEVGYGLEGSLTDAATSFIINSVILPKFKEGNFEGGIEDGLKAMIQAADGNLNTSESASEAGDDIIALLIVLVVFGGFVSILTVVGVMTDGCMGWFLYAFLMVFWAGLCAFIGDISEILGWAVFIVYVAGYPIARLLLPKTIWGKTMKTKFKSSTSRGGFFASSGSGWSSSGSGWSSGGGGWSSGGSSFSGGGGSFGGGGSSGSW